jgi:hypothetical protein
MDCPDAIAQIGRADLALVPTATDPSAIVKIRQRNFLPSWKARARLLERQ